MAVAAPVLSGTSEFDKVVLERPSDLKSIEEIVQQFSLELLAEEINSKPQYQSVALQFPDHLLKYSTQIAQHLQRNVVNPKVYVLADTSYSPCCVDEIAAQHVAADVIVHFGNTCLNPVRSLPVIYVFDAAQTFNVEKLADNFRTTYPDTSTHVLLLADSQYTQAVDALYAQIKDSYCNVLPTHLEVPKSAENVTFIPSSSVRVADGSNVSTELPDHDTTNTNITDSFKIPTRGMPPLKEPASDYSLFYLSSDTPSASLLLYLSTNMSPITLHDMNSYKTSSPYLNLKKRYKYMNMARSAGTIGILVNTLSLKNLDTVLNKVQQLIVAADKKYYTFVVGKPNVPKLANFDVVDIWVVLGCSIGGIVVDCDDYYKPIITPYELSLALKRDLTWDGRWLIDFDSILAMDAESDDDESTDIELNDELNTSDKQNSSELESEAPEFDPVTGKYVTSSRPLRRRMEHVEVGEGHTSTMNSLTAKVDSHLVIRNTTSTAAEYLNERTTWKGLGENNSDFGDNADPSVGADLEVGRDGIARGYTVNRGPKA